MDPLHKGTSWREPETERARIWSYRDPPPQNCGPKRFGKKCQMQLQTCELGKPQIPGADCRCPGDESPGKIVEQWLTRHPIDRKGVRATYRLRGARPGEDPAEAPRPRGGRAAHSPILPQDSRCECDQVPASHFFRKLVFAAPASFLPSFPTAPASQHFFMELALAAPASAFPSLLTALAAHAAPS